MRAIRQTWPVWALRRWVSRHESLYYMASRMRGHQQLARGTEDIVLDGYPRSANSWAEAALRVSQQDRGTDLHVAHHCHAAAQLLAGARHGLPTIVLLRNPADAVLSYREMLQEPISFTQLFKDYLALYTPLLPVAGRLCFVEFAQVTGDFGAVMARVNAQYDADFAVPVHDDDFVARVRARMDQISMSRTGQPTRYSGARGADFARQREARRAGLRHQMETELGSGPARAALRLYAQLRPLAG